jgi:hypothetical protein
MVSGATSLPLFRMMGHERRRILLRLPWCFPMRNVFTLLDFVKFRLPAGEFAFLPGSLTAEATGGCIPDQVLHLSTAAQYTGYRIVIGIVWETNGEDGRSLAKNVYRSMFLNTEGAEPHERTARALRYAVQQMRPSLPFVRWINFVHYGG